MTLQTEIDLPLPRDIKQGNPEDIQKYLKDLIDRLEDMYGDLAQNINGSIRQWTPTVYGVSTAGAGTYTRQVGWLRRAGIVTELWFDIEWSAHTGTGDLAVLVPYQAAASEGSPWIGVIESTSASNAFTAGYTYLTWRCEPDTTQGTIIENGDSVASQPFTIANAGGFSGYIQYLGQELENS